MQEAPVHFLTRSSQPKRCSERILCLPTRRQRPTSTVGCSSCEYPPLCRIACTHCVIRGASRHRKLRERINVYAVTTRRQVRSALGRSLPPGRAQGEAHGQRDLSLAKLPSLSPSQIDTLADAPTRGPLKHRPCLRMRRRANARACRLPPAKPRKGTAFAGHGFNGRGRGRPCLPKPAHVRAPHPARARPRFALGRRWGWASPLTGKRGCLVGEAPEVGRASAA
jgi:hypothetical protein